MTSKEPLLESWRDEKARPSVVDGDSGQQQKRVRARYPFSYVIWGLISGLIILSAVRTIEVKINDTRLARKQHVCTHHKDEMITDFKQVRTSFHLLFILPQIGLLRTQLPAFSSRAFNSPVSYFSRLC